MNIPFKLSGENIDGSKTLLFNHRGFDEIFGWGKVNLQKAVEMASGVIPIPTPTPTITSSATPIPTPTPTTIDAQAPVVSITQPVSGSTLASKTLVNISATDNVGITHVEFFVDGVLVKTLTKVPYSFNWNTSKVAVGSHTLTARAYDASGNEGASASVSVTKTSGGGGPKK